jgi:phenylacetate-coenzyme A ligase PaaK-like adenylate-forming protein
MQRGVIAQAFKTTIVSEYGCTEVGIIAMDCPAGTMHLMGDALAVKIVRDGEPVGSGEEGEILVTELYGSFMPLICYRTGDRGVLSEEPVIAVARSSRSRNSVEEQPNCSSVRMALLSTTTSSSTRSMGILRCRALSPTWDSRWLCPRFDATE